MIRRIELLPASYAQKRRERRNVIAIVLAGLVALLLLLGWWLVLGMRVSEAKDDLAAAQARNASLDARIADLQRFADLETEIRNQAVALQTVMQGDVDWPSIVTEIAMVVPGEVWFTNIIASAGQTEGAAPVGTETAEVQINENEPFGRIQFQGKSVTMPGVAKLLVRLATVKEFEATWLNSAAEEGPATGGRVGIIVYDSTIELNDKAASDRYQDPDDL